MRKGSRAVRERSLHVAVVHAGREICHIAAATSETELARKLGAYVAGNAGHQLWPVDAERAASLLSAGREEEAVELYFTAPCQRWQRERLSVRRVDIEATGGSRGRR